MPIISVCQCYNVINRNYEISSQGFHDKSYSIFKTILCFQNNVTLKVRSTKYGNAHKLVLIITTEIMLAKMLYKPIFLITRSF